ncbi:DnaJ-domain-containing protein [Aspergillus japonicus CBS 114.51]|uniref:DnaJ-domain-containing protein n=1 Tax=Aspergillus japonicus CBS 114.51 TaxID=1448312 RepID=A0A8T8X8D6_ASPJA|nr:DnaJ-domain-containing protein [Aspergillus japonicus CBS 114.51]RAH84144.1 DnaJ-domain-containing protein [Aspergillus japonicus CBS 114.51]
MSHPHLRTASSIITPIIHRQCRCNPRPRTASAATFTHIYTSHPRARFFLRPPRHVPSPQTSSFSTTTHHHASAREPTYYEVLDIPITASQGEIKKQFYTLSMRHHPDRNRDDPTASSRFARISSAYNVLSQPNKRAAYDRDHGIYAQYQSTRSTATAGQHPMGSYSSHSSHGAGANLHTKGASYAGSRPASGLSNRRGQFRGPPPSFYAHGGYGRTGRTAPGPGAGSGGGGGDAAGQSSSTAANDEDPTAFIHRNTVHHFNARGHYKTQSAEDIRRKERRQKAMEAALKEQYIGSPWGAAMRFAAVCGILVGAATVAGWFQWPREKASKQKDQLR